MIVTRIECCVVTVKLTPAIVRLTNGNRQHCAGRVAEDGSWLMSFHIPSTPATCTAGLLLAYNEVAACSAWL